MNDSDLKEILTQAHTIAVVGASTNPDKAAHRIPALLLEAGFNVIPVHPSAKEILGQTAYPSLADIPVPVDLVDVFRPSDEVPGVVRQAVEIDAPVVWVQLGLTSAEGRRIAEDASVTYIEDTCIGQEVKRLGVTHSHGE